MSVASFDQFSEQFAQALEFEGALTRDTQLDTIEEYDSIGKIRLGVVIEDLFDFEVPYNVLEEKKTLGSLYEYCVEEMQRP